MAHLTQLMQARVRRRYARRSQGDRPESLSVMQAAGRGRPIASLAVGLAAHLTQTKLSQQWVPVQQQMTCTPTPRLGSRMIGDPLNIAELHSRVETQDTSWAASSTWQTCICRRNMQSFCRVTFSKQASPPYGFASSYH